MIRHLLTPFAALLLLTASLGRGQDAAKDKKDAKLPDFYPLQVGNTWLYAVVADGKKSNTMTQISKIENLNGQALALLETPSAKLTEHLSQTDKGVFRHRLNGADVSPPFCLIKYPATVGSKWEGEFSVAPDGDKYRYSAEIQKEEEVAAPAGKFKTIRVYVQLEEKGQTVKTTYWFAKDVGVVKQSFDAGAVSISLELVKFERKK